MDKRRGFGCLLSCHGGEDLFFDRKSRCHAGIRGDWGDGKEPRCDGPVDAAYKAVDKIVGITVKLSDYSLRGVTGGKDAMGEVVVHVTQNGQKVLGRGASTDVIEASIRAYVNAINRILLKREKSDSQTQEKAEL